ncbi:MAG: type II toxin-antitoxin system RelE/ParE family toxin [Bacteroidales bacterium]|nr:type II toxin-antitoxin system RelE/ParE family toxin [Candidatus Minthousia equi]
MKKERNYVRQIVPFREYFKEFKRTLPKEVLEKIYKVFIYIMVEQVIPSQFFKSIEGVKGLYEIRVEESGNIYRIFCCMDEGNLVVLFNAFQKKTTKTPSQHIKRATAIMKEYFAEKAQLKNRKQ